MRILTATFVTVCVLCPRADAQNADRSAFGIGKRVESGSVGSLGARFSVFFAENDRVAAGLELGFSRLAGLETEFRMGPADQSVIQWERAQRKLWHATITVRRHWLETGPRSGLYAGGGTGFYYLSNRSEFWENGTLSVTGTDLYFRESGDDSIHFGLNFGGGWSFRPARGPRDVDLGVRMHMLPFGGGEGVRSVLTFSAGLSLF